MKLSSGITIAFLLIMIIPGNMNAQQSAFSKVFYDNYGITQAYSIIRSFDNNFMVAGFKDNSGLLIRQCR